MRGGTVEGLREGLDERRETRDDEIPAPRQAAPSCHFERSAIADDVTSRDAGSRPGPRVGMLDVVPTLPYRLTFLPESVGMRLVHRKASPAPPPPPPPEHSRVVAGIRRCPLAVTAGSSVERRSGVRP